MAAPLASDRAHPASGRVVEAFQITGRGVVVVFDDLEGVCQVGDRADIAGHAVRVTGIEMITYADHQKRRHGNVGLLLDGIDKPKALAAIGTRITFHPGEAP